MPTNNETMKMMLGKQQGSDPALSRMLEGATVAVKQALGQAVVEGQAIDLAFIGNASPVYEWLPCRMIDLDCFLFAKRLDRKLGLWLMHVQDVLSASLGRDGCDFEIRVVEGPYKPGLSQLDRPVIVAHLGVFTEATYLASAPLKRWAWRKYTCEIETDRLLRLAPPAPTIESFIHGNRGLLDRLSGIENGVVSMVEWTLPELETRPLIVDKTMIAFQECCFAYASNCARNHARALGMIEADRLANAEFFDWYGRTVFPSEALAQLVALKARSRNQGFDNDVQVVRELTLDYLHALASRLSHSDTSAPPPNS